MLQGAIFFRTEGVCTLYTCREKNLDAKPQKKGKANETPRGPMTDDPQWLRNALAKEYRLSIFYNN